MFTKPKGMLTRLSSESYFFRENARCFRPFSDTFWMDCTWSLRETFRWTLTCVELILHCRIYQGCNDYITENHLEFVLLLVTFKVLLRHWMQQPYLYPTSKYLVKALIASNLLPDHMWSARQQMKTLVLSLCYLCWNLDGALNQP